MLSIFIYQRKYSNQSHGLSSRSIEQAIANVSKYRSANIRAAVYNRQNNACKPYIFPNLLLILNHYQSMSARFEGKCKYFRSIKLDSSRKLVLSCNVLTNHAF